MKFHLFSLILACSYEYSYNLMLTATIMFRSFFFRLKHGLFHIALDISTILWYRPRGTISVKGWWQGQYEKGHVLIYLSHILPGQIICYCPRKMLLPRRQITRRKLCFYYTCKFGVISIKYVINTNYPQGKKLRNFLNSYTCSLRLHLMHRISIISFKQ
jgi:hypothetical protein